MSRSGQVRSWVEIASSIVQSLQLSKPTPPGDEGDRCDERRFEGASANGPLALTAANKDLPRAVTYTTSEIFSTSSPATVGVFRRFRFVFLPRRRFECARRFVTTKVRLPRHSQRPRTNTRQSPRHHFQLGAPSPSSNDLRLFLVVVTPADGRSAPKPIKRSRRRIAGWSNGSGRDGRW